MTADIKLLFLAGSARDGSLNKRLARLGADIAKANGIRAAFADLGDYPMPLYDGDLEAKSGPPENAHKLKALMKAHHGIFIASPEYNASVTPLLKNALDWVSRITAADKAPLEVYKTRVFAIGSASPGGFGGMRSLMALRQILTLGLGALTLSEQIAVPRAGDAFDDHGHLADKSQQELFKSIIQKLARAVHVLHGEGI